MTKLPTFVTGAIGLLLMLAAVPAPGAADDYPDRQIRLIIPFPPGGSNDVVGRIIATQLSETLGKQVFVALDPAASELWDNEKKGYKFFKSNPDKIVKSEEMVDYWAKWVEKYPIRSLEDGLAENDWAGWKLLTDRLGNHPGQPAGELPELGFSATSPDVALDDGHGSLLPAPTSSGEAARRCVRR